MYKVGLYAESAGLYCALLVGCLVFVKSGLYFSMLKVEKCQKIAPSKKAAWKAQRSFLTQGSIIGFMLVFQTGSFWSMQAGYFDHLGWMSPVVGQWIAQVGTVFV